ncbi:uncharacterized protein Bfra_010091 [Botrytis fragariae]|uniref:Uncharacterized protein n=1 Tax=Botrytis fragariae TaxID=1964551 RepID=A0A8H6AM89_9HELO|nr:uncharacterized protein Bfra_010091 [Botrytis fragariae]KAF5869946.1 hypothetical protein Bfra_010091 [Botrytis fragariae]
MANPETPRQNPRIPFEQKDISEPSFPTSPTPRPRPLNTNPSFTLHNPPPQPSSSSSSTQSLPSSRSYSSAPNSPTPPSNLTSKMRNLWNTSHSKSFLSNLNMGLATNFPLKNLNLHSKKSVSVARADEGVGNGTGSGRDEYRDHIIHADHTNYFNHSNQTNDISAATPIPKLSSPNGKPAKPLAYRAVGDIDTNPLFGPSTQHAEYLISRVEGQFMGPDTPPMGSPFGEVLGGGLLFGLGSGSGRYGDERIKGAYENENEGVEDLRGTGDRNQGGVKSRSGRGREKMIPKKQNQKTWKSIHQSCKEMLDSMHLSKCDSEVTKATGQENGNRLVGAEDYMGIVNDEDDDEGDETENDNTEKYDRFDVFTDAHSGPSCGKYWEKDQHHHRLIHTESQDSMVEIYTSSPISTSPSSFSSSFSRFASRRKQGQQKTQVQMQNLLGKPQPQEKSSTEIAPVFSSNSSLEKRSAIAANSNPDNRHDSSDKDTNLESQNQANRETDIEDTLDEFILTPRKPLQESDFAYMHMRPKPRTNPDATTGNPLSTMSENGNANGNIYRYRYPNDREDDDNEDARSSLDMEDSLYDDDEKPTPKFKLRMPRAEAEYPDFATMMDRDRDTNTDTYPSTPTLQTQIQTAYSWSQKYEFDADAALEASLPSLTRLQYEYQLQCLSGSQGSILS